MSENALARLTQSNFQRHRDEVFVRTDRMFAWVMAIQYALAVLFSLLTSARTWSGGVPTVHPHVWMAVLIGGALAVGSIALVVRSPGEASTRSVVALSQGLFSALLIHLSGGRIETHFHVFGSLALLAMYRDWRPIAINSAIVALDHALRGAFFPATLYGVSFGAEWRFIEHAGWILFEDAFLFVACFHTVREMWGMAERQAELELANGRIEAASAEIGRQSAILNSVLTGMQDGVVVVGTSGKIFHANPAVERIVGVPLEGVPIEDWSELFKVGDDTGIQCPLERLPLMRAIRGESVQSEIRVSHALTGEIVWLEISAEPLVGGEGDRIGGVAVFHDVTERRRILAETASAREQAERANQAKSAFLSRTSHELRTPLNAILGFTQTLAMEDLASEARGDLEEIERAGRQLLGLVDDVLDLASLDEKDRSDGEGECERVGAVALSEVLAEAYAKLVSLFDEREIRLNASQVDGGLYVLGNRERLRQVVVNVLANAIQSNRPGGSVRVVAAADVFGYASVAVTDEGYGIPPDRVDRLFVPFDRLDAETMGTEGHGLGLAIAQGFVQTLGGEILVASEIGVGSTFTIRLPLVEMMAVVG